VAKRAEFASDPVARERRIAVDPPAQTDTEQLTFDGAWLAAEGMVRASQTDSRLNLTFTDNRIDLLGRPGPGGGTLKVMIDGRPAATDSRLR
jgi:hypothetical protein